MRLLSRACVVGALLSLLAGGPLFAAGDGPVVRVVDQSGMIHPVAAAIIDKALDQAAEQGESLVILRLDTPGGLVTATEEIVKDILGSEVPVCVFVSPRGAHAASAGFFILLSSDVAAMAPVTRTGAASPIQLGGENQQGDVALKKVSEDLSALIRATARNRGRPAELAEKAVTEAKSWSAKEALDAGLIELIANDVDALIGELDGREITRSDGSTQVLELTGAEVVRHELKWGEEVKQVLMQPLVLLLLVGIASLGIYLELTNPGLILPGVVGAIALLIVLYVSQSLPVNYFAFALIGLGLILFLLEIKVVSYGMLTVAGAACLGVGLWFVFPRSIPGLRLSMWTFLPVIVFVVGLVALVTFLVARTYRHPVNTGREGMVGLVGEAAEELAPDGRVFVHGEYWNAHATDPVHARSRVRVVSVEGLKLIVEPVDGAGGGPDREEAT
jgi:membrane-bound serine protease (ClpP class)